MLLLWLMLPQAVAHAQHKQAGGKTRKAPRATKGHSTKAARPAPVLTPATPALPVATERRPSEDVKPQAKTEEERDLKRGERVEFDGRLIEGQTAAAGAIYLFERLPSELRSMVMERKGYRKEELETLYPNGLPPADRHPMGSTSPGPGGPAAAGGGTSGR